MALLDLAQDLGSFSKDPLKYCRYSYNWGLGDLRGELGLRQWQKDVLHYIGNELRSNRKIIRVAVSSGHGVGKSTLASILIDWGLASFEDSRLMITANTEPQLKTKTWPEVEKWHRLSLSRHLFDIEATSVFTKMKERRRNWRCDRITWNADNPAAFAGLHNKGKRIVLIFDEASEIHEKIWEVTLGALTDEDTEIIWLVLGNPTQNAGGFFNCFHRDRNLWKTFHLDARAVEGTNKAYLQELVDQYGEDSDIVRVRVRGEFPKGSTLQFIDFGLMTEAVKREGRYNLDDPLIAGLDIARGGDDYCVLRYRRGLDAKTIPTLRVPGSEVRDSMRLVSLVAENLRTNKPDIVFYDGTGVGGPVGDRLRQLGYNALEVQFGGMSPDPKCANMSSYMWQEGKEWLLRGGAIADEEYWANDFSREYSHDSKDRLVLERKDHMKRRGLASSDDADALFLTFAMPLEHLGYSRGISGVEGVSKFGPGRALTEYDPFSRWKH